MCIILSSFREGYLSRGQRKNAPESRSLSRSRGRSVSLLREVEDAKGIDRTKEVQMMAAFEDAIE